MATIKCDWITCYYNSKFGERLKTVGPGKCNNDGTIYLNADNYCFECGVTQDTLQCESYTMWLGEKNKHS